MTDSMPLGGGGMWRFLIRVFLTITATAVDITIQIDSSQKKIISDKERIRKYAG